MGKIKFFIQQSWLVIVCSFCFGLLIAIANAAWSPRIEQNKIEKLKNLMGGLLPAAENFEPSESIEITSPKGKSINSTIYKAVSKDGQCVGWAFSCQGPGFADKIELVVAVNKDWQNYAGFSVLSSNETPGFGSRIKEDYYRNQFAGAPAEKLNLIKSGDPKIIDSDIVAISGATVSSQAVIEIINSAVMQIKEKMQSKDKKSNEP